MDLSLILAVAAVVLAALAVFPGSLGIVKFTHKILASPGGALAFNVLALPLWILSVVLTGVAVYLAIERSAPRAGVLAAAGIVVLISIFGFLMHMRFMFKPVREPLYLTPDEAIQRFGENEEVAGVIDRTGTPYGYIARLARRPHIVYQNEGEAPFIMSHCILSHSSMAYELDERFQGKGVYISSVLANNLVFYDNANRCTVLQIQNQARDGSYQLKTLPTLMTSLAYWKRFYPDSKIWYRPKEWRDTFYLKLLARASIIDQNSPDLVYPLNRPADERLPLKEFVLGVHLGGEARAYPAGLFGGDPVVEDTLGGEPIVFLASGDGDFVQLFSARIAPDRTLSFRPAGADRFEDVETGSSWTCTGECVAGELKGRRLDAVPHYNKIFWCVWADYFPQTGVYSS